MKLYIADYLGDTHHLDILEHGAYLLLLMGMWRAGGSLPASDGKLARVARATPEQWAAVRATVMPLFQREGGKITHKRLAAEMAKYERVSSMRKEASRVGVSEKRKKNKKLDQPNGKQKPTIWLHNQNHNQSQIEASASIPPVVPQGTNGRKPKPAKPDPTRLVATKRCPTDFEPDATVWRVADEMGLSASDIERELATMKDHQFRTAHKDWQAVARNWLRRATPRGLNGHAPVQQLSFKMQDTLLAAEEKRQFDHQFNKLMEERYGPKPRGGDQFRDSGAVLALSGPKVGTG
jgi:uncharacterized protein YdaU (DUF1376 family)